MLGAVGNLKLTQLKLELGVTVQGTWPPPREKTSHCVCCTVAAIRPGATQRIRRLAAERTKGTARSAMHALFRIDLERSFEREGLVLLAAWNASFVLPTQQLQLHPSGRFASRQWSRRDPLTHSYRTSSILLALVLPVINGCSSSSTTVVSPPSNAGAGNDPGTATGGNSATAGSASRGGAPTTISNAGTNTSGGNAGGTNSSAGGSTTAGGTNEATNVGGTSSAGGAMSVGGTQAISGSSSTGGAPTGGVTSTAIGGTSAVVGGASAVGGGSLGTGGLGAGGLATGGAHTGGATFGGNSTGGSSGSQAGGAGTGGTNTTGTGGAPSNPCATANPCVRGTCDGSSGVAKCLCPQTWGGLDCSTLLCTLCVDDNAPSGGSGECWLSPLKDLQTALSAADGLIPSCSQGVQIWVAEGTYLPSSTGDRAASFVLRDNVSIFGGFAGTESAISQRTPSAHVTVLSGDLSSNDVAPFTNNGENSLHVVTGVNNASSAALDGVTIKGGNADTDTGYGAKGGGMYVKTGSPKIVGVTFLQNFAGGNFAYAGGGALYIEDAKPSISSSTFRENLAACGTGYNGGGAIYSYGASSTRLQDVLFLGNRTTAGSGAYQGGGAIYAFGISVPLASPAAALTVVNARFLGNFAGSQDHQYSGGGAILALDTQFTIVNSAFAGNSTTGAARGGALYALFDRGIPQLTNVTMAGNSTAADGRAIYVFLVGDNVAKLTNSIVWGNTGSGSEIAGDVISTTYTCAPGILSGSGNLPACNPLLVAPSGSDAVIGTLDDDLRLQAGSPALNVGNNLAAGLTGITSDLANNTRFSGVVDLGAYERP